jgi:NitT/TauT family transport system substrate-binding protein
VRASTVTRSLLALVLLALCACSPAAPAAPAATAPAAAPKPAATTSASPSASPAVATGASPSASPSTGASASPSASPAAAASAASAQAVQTMAGVKPLAQRATVRVAFNPTLIGYLPLLVAMDKGYFAQAGIDIDAKPFNASAATQLPLLARGDLDISPMVSVPATYNQFAQGFNVMLIAGFGTPKPGRASDAWLTVRQDKVEQIKSPADVRGKTVEGGTDGTPFAVLAYGLLDQAHLTPGSDLTLQFKARGTADMLAMAQGKVADVIAMTEPTATNAEQQGLAKRWLTYADLAPWYQSSMLGASGDFLQNHPAVAAKFLEVFAVTCREIDASNGAWTDDLIQVVSNRAGVSADIVKAEGGVPYYDPNVPVSLDSLDRTQQLWVRNGQVQEPIDVQKLVDTQTLNTALQDIGRAQPTQP